LSKRRHFRRSDLPPTWQIVSGRELTSPDREFRLTMIATDERTDLETPERDEAD
jgi:hypothetical protein